MFTTYPHSQYYRDRTSERELCCDFPGDELFIRGLRAMELHLARYNGYVHIPVMRVMNTVHRAICILLHGNSGYEQSDYDQAIHQALGQERLLTGIAMVTLIAILRRTDGQRARQCRSMLMDDRSEDFYEGVELYERLIGPTELRLNEEDFLTDVMRQITDLQNTVQQLTNDNQQLKQQIQTMSKTKTVHIGYNVEQMTINMSGGTLVQHADLVQAGGEVTVQQETSVEDIEQVATEPQSALPFFVPEKLAELGTATAEEFDALYHNAVQAGAPKLATFIKHYRELQVLNTKGYNKKKTYEQLKAYFGEELGFGYANFAAYY